MSSAPTTRVGPVPPRVQAYVKSLAPAQVPGLQVSVAPSCGAPVMYGRLRLPAAGSATVTSCESADVRPAAVTTQPYCVFAGVSIVSVGPVPTVAPSRSQR